MWKSIKFACFLVGTYKLVDCSYQIYQGLDNYYLSKVPNLAQTFGDYALITSSETPLAQAYATFLAQNKINLIFLSVDGTIDSELHSNLQKNSIDIKTIQFDSLNSETKLDYKNLLDQLIKYDISFLINSIDNEPEPIDFEKNSLLSIKKTIIGNILPPTVLMSNFISIFEKRTKRSAIINVGSQTGECLAPFQSVYAGTRSFFNYMSKGVAYEVSEKVGMVLVTPPKSLEKEEREQVVVNSFKNVEGKK